MEIRQIHEKEKTVTTCVTHSAKFFVEATKKSYDIEYRIKSVRQEDEALPDQGSVVWMDLRHVPAQFQECAISLIRDISKL